MWRLVGLKNVIGVLVDYYLVIVFLIDWDEIIVEDGIFDIGLK